MSKIKYPGSIQWEVTSYCNHDCIHCYNYWRSNNTKKQDIEFNNKVDENYYYEIAKKIVESKPVRVIITGGEPFSVFDKLKKSIILLINNNISVSINTNATLLNDNILLFLKKYKIRLFISLPCSNSEICDKITNVKGSLKNIEKSIILLKNNGIPLSINMVVSHINKDFIFSTAKYVKEELGLNYFCATKACLPINAKEEFSKNVLSLNEINELFNVLSYIKKELNMNVDSSTVYSLCGIDNLDSISCLETFRRCNAGRTTFAITSNGDIKACARDNTTYGNILECTFEEAIEKMIEWQNGGYFPEECLGCKQLSSCGTGCRIDALVTNNNIKKLDSTSNIINKNRTCTMKNKIYIKEDDLFELNPKVIIIKESDIYRLSYNYGFNYVSKEFYDFIKENKTFNLTDLLSKFNIPKEIIIKNINNLVKLGIINVIK